MTNVTKEQIKVIGFDIDSTRLSVLISCNGEQKSIDVTRDEVDYYVWKHKLALDAKGEALSDAGDEVLTNPLADSNSIITNLLFDNGHITTPEFEDFWNEWWLSAVVKAVPAARVSEWLTPDQRTLYANLTHQANEHLYKEM